MAAFIEVAGARVSGGDPLWLGPRLPGEERDDAPHRSVGSASRSHVGVLPDGTKVKLGVFLSISKRRRTKLTSAFVEPSVNHVIHGLRNVPYRRGQSNDTTKVKIRWAPSTTKL